MSSMNDDFINLIEPTPIPKTKKCKILSILVRILLQFGTVAIGLIAWYMYDYFIAIAALLLSFIIMGIIRSKLRNSAIPLTQQEYHYNDDAIAKWYVAKTFCQES